MDAKELINQTLDYYKYKINNDLCTMEEIESVSEMLQKNLNVIGTVEDFSRFCDIPQSHVRNIISRKVLDKPNEGFTFSNGEMRKALVVIGPTTSGKEFQDSLVHEIHHLAVAIAKSLGVNLEGETPAYISGDSARELAGIVCELGCDQCRE